MTQYRRSLTPGSTYFFTVNLSNRRSKLLTSHVEVLRKAFAAVMAAHPFVIDAMVVMPDHLHAVWTMPPDDADYALRWRLIKTRFSRAMPRTERRSVSRMAKGERGIWQRRYWEHEIRDAIDMQRHVDYIHINPVKHGYVARAADWPHSSIHRFIERGDLPCDWACDCEEITMGERA
ncbi:transposase [Pseudoluteimonas lycopersici]|uniref:Transposase n=1 Tax=Pseudoluteimonas lycopersici TaxID=1324796 RepID=A0A516V545_9GAMM|nr:transposase [Lysobacter lycopersici]QDQ73650.1 transposase [Lysobacter lycopersici]